MTLNPVVASNAKELLDILSSTDISVPFLGKDRRNEHRERWSMYRLLATIVNSKLLQFPLELHHHDRPDYHIKHGSLEIGVEVTEVVPENAKETYAFRQNKQVEGPLVFLKRYRPNESRLTRSLLRSAATSDEPSDGWPGSSAECEWVDAILESIYLR